MTIVQGSIAPMEATRMQLGHNSKHTSDDVLHEAAQTRLRTIIQRIERLETDNLTLKEDIKEVFSEAKGEGFDTKILRKVIRLRKQDAAKRSEEEALVDLYLSALGGL